MKRGRNTDKHGWPQMELAAPYVTSGLSLIIQYLCPSALNSEIELGSARLWRVGLGVPPRPWSLAILTGSNFQSLGTVGRRLAEPSAWGFTDALIRRDANDSAKPRPTKVGLFTPRTGLGGTPRPSSHTIFKTCPGKKFVGRCFRRDAENNTPEAGAPYKSPPSIAEPTSEFGPNGARPVP